MVDLGSLPPEVGHTRPEPEAVSIDRDALKLLASDTRLDILKALKNRRMTVSELAAALKLGKSTVFEHVTKLTDGGLVVRHADPKREWVYYELSPKAKRLLQPSSAKIVLLFSTVVALGAAVAAVWLLASSTAMAPLEAELDKSEALAGATEAFDLRLRLPSGDPAVGNYRVFLIGESARHDLVTTGRLADAAGASDGASDLVKVEPRALALTPQGGGSSSGASTFQAALRPGSYYVYAVSEDGKRDNKGNLPRIDVTAADARAVLSPLLVGADDGRPVPVALSHLGKPVAGARVVPDVASWSVEDVAPPAATGADGVTTVRLSFEHAGVLSFDYSLPPHALTVRANGSVPVVRPEVVLDTSAPAAGPDSTVTATVFDESRGAVEGAPVNLVLEGETVAHGATDAFGRARLSFEGSSGATYDLLVGGTRFGAVTPVEPLRLELVEENETLVAVRVTAAGAPMQGAEVSADGDLVGVTDADGRLESSALANATHVRAGVATNVTGARYLDAHVARSGSNTGAPPAPSVVFAYRGEREIVVPSPGRDKSVLFRVPIVSVGESGDVLLTLYEEGRAVGTTSVQLASGEVRTVAFAVRVPSAQDARFTVRAEGAADTLVSFVVRGDSTPTEPPHADDSRGRSPAEPAAVPAPGVALVAAVLLFAFRLRWAPRRRA